MRVIAARSVVPSIVTVSPGAKFAASAMFCSTTRLPAPDAIVAVARVTVALLASGTICASATFTVIVLPATPSTSADTTSALPAPPRSTKVSEAVCDVPTRTIYAVVPPLSK